MLLLGLLVTACAVELQLPVGRLRGRMEGQVEVYRGVPYGQAPLGALRWRAPVPFGQWEGVRDAITPTTCWQIPYKEQNQVGSEDCLHLNIHLPPGKRSGLPCLVFIHGGGYELGAGNIYNGSNLVDYSASQDLPAIVVTVNYRLNIFGFLGSEQLRDVTGSTGNFGIQDQRLALRWVRENLEAMGGDPNRVMIFGQSAGAGAVGVQLSTPRSEGLFSKALMESGGFAGWSARSMQKAEWQFQTVLKIAGCETVSCLRSLPAEDVLKAYLAIPGGRCCSTLFGDPTIPWAPTIDGVELMAHPRDLLRDKKVNKAIMVIGSTLDDGADFELQYDLTNFTPYFLAKYGPAAATVLPAYAAESHPSYPGRSPAWWKAERVVTDMNFFCSQRLLAQSLGAFQYQFGSAAGGKPIISHSSELPFVWMDYLELKSDDERQLSKAVALSWLQLAYSGNPSHGNLSWPREAGSMVYFQVASAGGTHVTDATYRDRRCEFMNSWIDEKLALTEILL